MIRNGYDTKEIARHYWVREDDVWNRLAMAERVSPGALLPVVIR